MRLLLFLAFLTVLAAAQEQVPLGDRVQGWLNKAKSYMPTATPVVPPQQVQEPEKLPEKPVTHFNLNNYQSLLEPSTTPQDWFVFVTGGNKTCFGMCDRAEKEFTESVNLFAADKQSPRLGYVNCDANPVLCSSWSASPPSVWYFEIPQAQAEGERPETPLHIMSLNATTVTSEDIFKLYGEKTYLTVPKDESALHPTDGWAAKTGANIALGYVLYGLNVIPSWFFMIGISFVSRTMMGRRMGGAQQNRGGAPAPRPS